MYQARLPGDGAGLTAVHPAIVGGGWMKLVRFKLLALDRWAGLKQPWAFRDHRRAARLRAATIRT